VLASMSYASDGLWAKLALAGSSSANMAASLAKAHAHGALRQFFIKATLVEFGHGLAL